ncbi:decapping endonuclease targeting mRNA [Polyrhizophydium stewartii]|uniref:Extracellular metalloproteinase n=1 Tax=Polyrhizophydium stewartii TaxID=2732419 RepID=A0ABR4MYK9_9FUNG
MRASFTLALTLASAATTVLAAPATSDALQRRAAGKLPFFFPESVYENVAPSGNASFGKVSEAKAVQIATDFLTSKLGLAAGEFKVYNSFTDASGTTHVYGAQQANGVRIANHQAAAHVQNGQVVSFSSSFNTGASLVKPRIPPVQAKLTVDEAIAKAVKDTGIPHHKDFAAVSEYVNTGNGIVFAHKFQLRDSSKGQWVQVWVDANTGEIVHSADFVKKSSYKVVAVPNTNPLQGFTTVSNPEDATASPNGWSTSGTTTNGNNADVAKRTTSEDPVTYGTGSGGVFTSSWSSSSAPSTSANVQTTAVNLFYIANVLHDISYQYGFTEAAGNFQVDNFGKGGQGNDAVTVSVQDPNGTDNADFSTPADGQAPLMRMFVFTATTPNRDGGLENPIPLHEYTHGISNRLTGGSATGQCLETTESGGMGEGWSDFVALVVTAKSTDTGTQAIPVGTYVENNTAGIRSYPYSTSLTTNPLKYSSLASRTEVHDIGEVWVELLWEVYWNLVNKYGFSTNLYDAKSTAGNVVALQLVIGGMMAQPCNPTIIQARDAILTADQTYYGGKNKCDIWAGFAKRGAGFSATTTKTDKFDLPAECSGTATTTKAARTTKAAATTKAATTTKSPTPSPTPASCDPNNICCIYFGFDC